MSLSQPINSVIFGIKGTVLEKDEINFFKETNPIGFILFKRNIDSPNQVKDLVKSFEDCVQRKPLILIDQEGGRVARLQPPSWPEFPAMSKFAKIALDDIKLAEDGVYKNSSLIAKTLTELGINVDCAPVADLFFKGADKIIGDRSFGDNVEIVSKLVAASAKGFIDNDVIPIVKHIPGHGRAKADSHKELPIVDTDIKTLYDTDFKVFKNVNNLPMAMTAHILYSQIDNENCATQSKKVIDIIRNDIGFKGILITDDLSMHALSGSFYERAKKSYEAGCDIILHCNGDIQEMKAIRPALQPFEQTNLDYILRPCELAS